MTPKFIHRWRKNLFRKFKKDPIRNTLIILVAPVMIYFVAKLLFDFSVFASTGYVLVCIYAFANILDDPTKVMTWGAGYLMGTIAIGLVFNELIPTLSRNDWTSFFAAFVLIYIIIAIWAKSCQIRKIKKR